MTPLNFKGIYNFYFAGVPIGRMGIEAEQSADSYAIAADIASVGVVNLFAKHSSHNVVSGNGSDVVYETHYRTKDKKRHVKLTYNDGEYGEEIVEPPDNRAKRPAVKAEEKRGAYDPLSLNLALRRMIWEARAKEPPSFSVNVYDGRRLTQLDVSIGDEKTVRSGKTIMPAVQVAVRRKLLAGFTASEIEDYSPKEPTLWIYYSDDGRFVPVWLEIKFLFGKLTAQLAKECRTGESCLLGIKE